MTYAEFLREHIGKEGYLGYDSLPAYSFSVFKHASEQAKWVLVAVHEDFVVLESRTEYGSGIKTIPLGLFSLATGSE